VTGAGDIVLCSCYELGHQPYGLASPLAALTAAGFAPVCLDLAVDELDADALATLAHARLVAISVPMHTALRLGVALAARVRAINPAARLCFYGLYAPLNAAYLRGVGAAAVLGAEYEAELVALAQDAAPGDAEAQDPRRMPSWSSRACAAPVTRNAASPATPRPAAAACTCAGIARSRRSTTAASSPCRRTSCSPTWRSRSPRARATSPSAIPTS
jgi:hypothetical protein